MFTEVLSKTALWVVTISTAYAAPPIARGSFVESVGTNSQTAVRVAAPIVATVSVDVNG